MRLLFISIAFIFINLDVLAQKHDYVWLFGSDSQADTSFAGTVIDFNANPPDIYYEFREVNFDITNASMCGANGQLLFYTNGINVYNWGNGIMENGAGLNPGEFADNHQDIGYILEQGAMALPVPESGSLFYLVHLDVEYPTGNLAFHSKHAYFSLIDMSLNSGAGEVLIRNELIFEDNLDAGGITATRHANGRDWWILLRKYGSNEYYRLLAGPNSIRVEGVQLIGDAISSNSIGQAVFSPDGIKYVHLNLVGYVGDDIHISIFDFDRCTGELSEPLHLTYVDSASSGGVAISPNSRFLYVSSFKKVYQYDLWAEDIPASKDTVAVWDGFMVPPIFATTFFLMQLGPDGKIYINSNYGVPYLHVINHPDLPGDSCDVCQHCVALPSWNSFSMPNFPNYRLGHLPGSPCDTLRQPPTAAFGYEQDGPALRFTDSSYHDIRRWRWEFGDGQADTLPSPVHVYDSTGVYEVCLTVSNPRGEDTACEEVAVVVSGVSEGGSDRRESRTDEGGRDRKWGVRVFPGLFRERFAVLLPEGWLPQQARLLLYDGLGRRVLSQRLRAGANEVAAGSLPAGVYFYVVEESGVVVAQGRVVKR